MRHMRPFAAPNLPFPDANQHAGAPVSPPSAKKAPKKDFSPEFKKLADELTTSNANRMREYLVEPKPFELIKEAITPRISPDMMQQLMEADTHKYQTSYSTDFFLKHLSEHMMFLFAANFQKHIVKLQDRVTELEFALGREAKSLADDLDDDLNSFLGE